MKEKALELETRREIFQWVEQFPGLHLREIERQLDITSALAEYHLNYLQKHELVMSIEEGGYRRYYPHYDIGDTSEKPQLSSEDKRIVGLMRGPIPFQIVLFLMGEQGRTHKEISDGLKISRSTLTYHLKKLIQLGVVQKKARGPSRGFFIQHPRKMRQLMIQYKPTPDVLETYGDMWMNVYRV